MERLVGTLTCMLPTAATGCPATDSCRFEHPFVMFHE